MTVYTQEVEYEQDGDGVSHAFVFPGLLDDLSDLRFAVVDTAGQLVERTGSVSGGVQGATVAFSVPPATGERVLMWRDTPTEQRVDYAAGDFPSETHEQTADRLVLMAQERKRAEVRVLRFDRTGPALAEMNTADFTGRFVGVREDGQPVPSAYTAAQIENAASVVSKALAEQGISRGAPLDFGLITTAPDTIEDWGSIT